MLELWESLFAISQKVITSTCKSARLHVWFAHRPTCSKSELYKVAALLSRMQQQGSRCLRLCMLQAYADLAPTYVTAAAAGARGVVRFGTRMSTEEFQARGRSSSRHWRENRTWRLHMCEDEPSGRLTFALVSISVFLHALADFSRVPPAAVCTVGGHRQRTRLSATQT